MNEARLRRLQFAERPLGGVAGGAHFLLGAPAFGDVAVDQHEAAARQRVVPYLDDMPVRPGTLKGSGAARPRHIAVDLRVNVDIAKLAAPGEMADIILEGFWRRHKIVRQSEDF